MPKQRAINEYKLIRVIYRNNRDGSRHYMDTPIEGKNDKERNECLDRHSKRFSELMKQEYVDYLMTVWILKGEE